MPSPEKDAAIETIKAACAEIARGMMKITPAVSKLEDKMNIIIMNIHYVQKDL